MVLRAGYTLFLILLLLVLFEEDFVAYFVTIITQLPTVMADLAKAISSARRRRGVVRASTTCLTTKIGELEGHSGDPAVLSHCQQMIKNLEGLNSDFKKYHLALVDLLEDKNALEEEQHVLDEHDETVDLLLARINQLLSSNGTRSNSEPRKIALKHLTRLDKNLATIQASLPGGSVDICLIRQYEEKLHELKSELGDISRSLLPLDLEDDDDLMDMQTDLESRFFDASLNLKRMIDSAGKASSPKTTTTDGKGVKLPKIDVPTFDGSVIQWRTFWEQFTIAVNSRTEISGSEKLVYLRHSVKDGTAKGVIEGLSRTGDHYSEAVECLKTRYDRPRLIHQAHVKRILDVPALKDGNGRELRKLHDTVQQHLRALKAMGYEPSGPFITSTLELKLDSGTMFQWQKHSQKETTVPHYQELLKFLSLHAQASETSVVEKRPSCGEARKSFIPNRPVTSFTANATPTVENCILCKSVKHPLYSCSKFKALPHDQMLATLKANHICINCLRPGHHLRECRSFHCCRECQKPHYSLLHMDARNNSVNPTPSNTAPSRESPAQVPSLAATGLHPNPLLMTCQVLITTQHGLSMKARALLDSGSCLLYFRSALDRDNGITP